MLLTIIKILDMIFSISGIVYLLTVAIERKDGIVEDEIISRISSISAVYSLSQIGYDMQVVLPDSDSRTIAYLTLSKKYPNSLCLVTDSKEFPIMNSGCGISKNPTPYDVIFKLKEDTKIKKVIAIVDNKVYDLDPGYVKMNHYDSILRFERARNLIYL